MMTVDRSEDYVPVLIRMPASLRDRIKLVSAQQRRSMNKEFIHRLEKSFENCQAHAESNNTQKDN